MANMQLKISIPNSSYPLNRLQKLQFKYFFTLTASLRRNSHTIQFTHFKSTTKFFQYIHSYATITTINFTTISSPQNRNLLVITPHFLPNLPLTKPRQPLIYFLSLWISLFWTFHINGIIYVIFCAWLLSRSILFPMFMLVIACTSTLFLFIVK